MEKVPHLEPKALLELHLRVALVQLLRLLVHPWPWWVQELVGPLSGALLPQLLGVARLALRDALGRLESALLKPLVVGHLPRADKLLVLMAVVLVMVGAVL